MDQAGHGKRHFLVLGVLVHTAQSFLQCEDQCTGLLALAGSVKAQGRHCCQIALVETQEVPGLCVFIRANPHAGPMGLTPTGQPCPLAAADAAVSGAQASCGDRDAADVRSGPTAWPGSSAWQSGRTGWA